MKKTFILNCFIILAYINVGIAGDMDSGGTGEYGPDYNAAWFLQNKNENRCINICINHNETTFPIRIEEIKKDITAAFNQWDQYVEKKKLYDEYKPDDDDFYDQKELKLVTKINFINHCGPKSNYDLKFFLGTSNKFIDKIKRINPKLAGYAHKENYDPATGYGKGFIWVNYKFNNSQSFCWNKNSNLHGVLLHEIGHILGNSHVAGTIMTKDLATRFICNREIIDTDQRKYYETTIKRIDQSKILKKCNTNSCLEKMLSGNMWLRGSNEEKETFKLLTGRLPVGDVKVSARLNYTMKNGFILEINDDKNKFQYVATFDKSLSLDIVSIDQAVFKRYRFFSKDNKTMSITIGGNSLNLHNVYGTLTGKKNITFPIQLRENMFRWEVSPPSDESAIYEYLSPYSIFIFGKTKRHYVLSNVRKYSISNMSSERIRDIYKILGKQIGN